MFIQSNNLRRCFKNFLLLSLLCALLPACLSTRPELGIMAVPAIKGSFVLEVEPAASAGTFLLSGTNTTGVSCEGVLKNITPATGENCSGQLGEIRMRCTDSTFVTASWTSLTCSSGMAYGSTSTGYEVYMTTGGTLESQLEVMRVLVKSFDETKSKMAAAQAAKEAQSYQASSGARRTAVSGNERAVPPKALPGTLNSPVVDKVKGSGTGFFVSSNGLVVTNAHVVKGARLISIANSKERTIIPARLIKLDSSNDLALLKADVQSSPIPLSSSFNAKKGEEVLTLGYPIPSIQGVEQKATFGRVNSFTGIGGDERLVQVDLPVQPGNSGGPLLNSKGEVIGIVSATLNGASKNLSVQNVNYAIKVDYLYPLLASVAAQTTKSPQAQKKDFPSIVSLREDAVVIIVVE